RAFGGGYGLWGLHGSGEGGRKQRARRVIKPSIRRMEKGSKQVRKPGLQAKQITSADQNAALPQNTGISSPLAPYRRTSLTKSRRDQGSGSRHGLRVVAETGKPMDAKFPAKPGDLALGILARALLDRGLCRFERDFAAKMGAQFTIADEVEGLGALGETRGDYAAH